MSAPVRPEMPDWLRRAMVARPDATRTPGVRAANPAMPPPRDTRPPIPTIGPATGMRGVPVPRGEAQGVGTPQGSVPVLDAMQRNPRQTALDVLTAVPGAEVPVSMGAAAASALGGDAAGTAAYAAAGLPLVSAPSFVKKGIEAWHGTRHKFDKFDLSKIGTGEGNQVFGHGLYFAEAKPTAEWYRKTLASGDNWRLHGKDGRVVEVDPYYGRRLDSGQLGIADLISDLNNKREDLRFALSRPNVIDPEFLKMRLAEVDAKAAEIRGLETLKAVTPGGYTYRVGIDANTDELLDLDAPMHEQSKKVQTALRDAGVFEFENLRPDQFPKDGVSLHNGGRIVEASNGRYTYHSPSGNEFSLTWQDVERLYGDPMLSGEGAQLALSRAHGPKGASELLRGLGIPGLQYFDEGSRSTRKGTRNYVMFDDKRVTILERLAAAGLLAGGSGAIARKKDNRKDAEVR